MSFRSAHEQLKRAREILNLGDDVERAQVEAAIAALRANGECVIAASRPSIQPRLREALDDCEADYEMVGTFRSYEWGE